MLQMATMPPFGLARLLYRLYLFAFPCLFFTSLARLVGDRDSQKSSRQAKELRVTHCVLGRHQSQLMKGHQLLYRLTRLRQKSLVERGMFARAHMSITPKHLRAVHAHFLHCHHQKKRKRKSMQYPAARLLTFGLTLPRQSRQQRKFRDWHSKRTLRERVEPNGKDGKNHWDSRQQSLKFNAPNHGLLCLN